MMNGGKVLLNVLKNEGVEKIFGYPGGAVIPLYNELYDMTDHFDHYRTAHEQAAVHGADAYARVSGKPGVCFATSGPGATNTVTGIANAYMDSVPMVIITGQVPSALMGRDSFQEIDITGVTMSITKHNFIIKKVEDIEKTVKDALKLCNTGRKGPVLIDVPKDFFSKEVDWSGYEGVEKTSVEDLMPELDKLDEAVEKIKKSKRPVIYAGGGVLASNSAKELFELAVKNDIPVVNTLMGLGTFPRDHKNSLGMVGMHGFSEANMAVTDCDLLIAVGARFSDRVIGHPEEFAKRAEIIHIDIDRTEIGKNMDVSLYLMGNASGIMKYISDNLDEIKRNIWFDEIYSNEKDIKYLSNFNPKTILETVNGHVGDNSIVATDVGQHQMWTAQYWKFKNPKSFITSGGLGTMGFGLGAAIGAKIAEPKKDVVLITGDGSFRMNCNEMATLSGYGIPVLMVMFNNNALGMVRQWQKMFQEERYSETCINNDVDYVKLSEAYNIKGFRVNNEEELKEALKSYDGKSSVFIECLIEKDENVIPIVPPGKPIYDLITGW
jgi:acetolactate synthase-1/2/3 large subunit